MEIKNAYFIKSISLFWLCCCLIFITSASAQINPTCVDLSQINTNVACPAVYNPVCGCDGVTYGNSCEAYYWGGVISWTSGPCATTSCNANFAWNLGIVPPTVFFTDISTGNPYQWHWDFGDGNTSTLQDPAHDYMYAGEYVVCLTIYALQFGGISCIDTYCDTIQAPGCIDTSIIDLNAACPAIFNPVCGCDGNTYPNSCVALKYNGVTMWSTGPCPPPPCEADFSYTVGIFGPDLFFFDLSTGNPTAWQWDFGDGNTSNLQDPLHRYDVAGTYIVCLTILSPGPNACFDTYCDTIQAPGCVEPATIDSNAICPDIYDPVCGCNGETYINSCEAQNYGGVTIWTPGPCGYCPSYAINSNIGWINRVGPNTSGNNGGYALFNYCNFTFTAGQTVQVPLFVGANNPPAGVVAHWRLWIDYNQDEDFDDPGEMAWQGLGPFPKAIFTIPNNVCSGCTRLRFQVSDLFRPACGPYQFGETEDYMVTMLGTGIACKDGADFSGVTENSFGSVIDLSATVNLFPNPATDQVSLQFEGSTDDSDVSVIVYNLEGKQVIFKVFIGNSFGEPLTISTTDLANGIYQVAIQTSTHSMTEKLIIAK